MDLQEFITRGRFIFAGAPERLKLYRLVDGKRNTLQLSKVTRRHVNSVRRDLNVLTDAELLQHKSDKQGNELRVGGFPVFEKIPLGRTVSINYFRDTIAKIPGARGHVDASSAPNKSRLPRRVGLPVPTETEILDICKVAEDQTHEFKAAGTDVRKITKEIAAMLNTRGGGLVLYGIEDDGTIQGSDVSVQKLDQPLQNSIKNSIAPAATVQVKAVLVLGTQVIVIVVPPWNRRDVYQFDEKVLIRKGTNVFGVRPEELRRLHKGQFVI